MTQTSAAHRLHRVFNWLGQVPANQHVGRSLATRAVCLGDTFRMTNIGRALERGSTIGYATIVTATGAFALAGGAPLPQVAALTMAGITAGKVGGVALGFLTDMTIRCLKEPRPA